MRSSYKEKKTEWYSEKSQNKNKFCNGLGGDDLGTVDGVCRSTEDGIGDGTDQKKSSVPSLDVFSVWHKEQGGTY